MKHCIYICLLLIVILNACHNKAYKPEGLTKLSDTELIERAKEKRFPDMQSVVYKNEQGEIISLDSLMKIPNPEEWTTDSYVDNNGDVKEAIVRRATAEDKELQKRIQEAFNYLPPIEIIDIDCSQKQEILQTVYESDQGTRTNGTMDPEIDRKNLTTVISLIENCGMPTLEEVNETQMSAIWLTIQHGDHENRKKYFPLLEQSAKNGDLRSTEIAMMKDRILMGDGKPQVYGTQITQKDGQWVLYELSDPESVNKRRTEIGFGPIEDYLKRWNIEFNVKQVQ